MKDNNSIEFLSLAEIIDIHDNQIKLYGGDSGIRDIKLLSSAVAMPKATFDNQYLHQNIFEMAAAYCYHLCQNHPFIDGNKRAALVSALVFLDTNNIEYNYSEKFLYNLMINITQNKIDKMEIAKLLKKKGKSGGN